MDETCTAGKVSDELIITIFIIAASMTSGFVALIYFSRIPHYDDGQSAKPHIPTAVLQNFCPYFIFSQRNKPTFI